MNTSRLTILISGMIAGVPWQGGATWAVLQYILGFRNLGHEVYFVEAVEAPTLRPADVALEHSENASYFRKIMRQFGLDRHSALLIADTHETVGLAYTELCRVAQQTDVLVNISGTLADKNLIGDIPLRVYLDLDPAFNQLWHATQGIDMRFAAHNYFVTVGLALNQPGCTIPTCGKNWITTLQPVVLEYWPSSSYIKYDALTTVANWRGYGSIEYQGLFYGQKAHSLRQFVSLPTRVNERFILALAIHQDEQRDLIALASNGWRLLDPSIVACDPTSYQRFIQESKAEFGIAKSGYVVARCGWFSDRSACYLASGRPVISQETGFSHMLPTGVGLLAFETLEEAIYSIETLEQDYRRHALAARALAEEYFDSNKVLVDLLRRIGAQS